jgi:hypothetical protein
MRRRTLVAALVGACLLVASAGAKETGVLKVEGVVTAKNFPGLAAFLSNSLDGVVGLSLRLDPAEGTDPGSLVVTQDGDLLIAYQAGGDVQISAREGLSLEKHSHFLSGFFVVKNAGFNQGISALFLDKTGEDSSPPSGAAVKVLDIDRLDPAIHRQD